MPGQCQGYILSILQLGKVRNAGANSSCRAECREDWEYTNKKRSALHVRNENEAKISLDPENFFLS